MYYLYGIFKDVARSLYLPQMCLFSIWFAKVTLGHSEIDVLSIVAVDLLHCSLMSSHIEIGVIAEVITALLVTHNKQSFTA